MTKESLRELVEVYGEHGHDSNEFVIHVIPYLNYLQMRLLGYVDDDFRQECLVRILDSFRYYDAECGVNVASWVFSVVRNKASSWRGKKKRLQRESVFLDEGMLDDVPEGVEDSWEQSLFREEDMCRWFVSALSRVTLEVDSESIVEDMTGLGMESVLVRGMMWSSISHGGGELGVTKVTFPF